MAQTNSDYSIINVQEIVELIQDLHTFGLQTFHVQNEVIFRVTYTPAPVPGPVPIPLPPVTVNVTATYIITILDYAYAGTTDYIVFGCLIDGTENPKEAKGHLPPIFFSTVSAIQPIVLVSSVQLLNALRVQSMLLGTNVYMYYKSEPYLYNFYVNDTDRLREHKGAILNLFTTTMRTYVLFNSLVIHFIKKNNAFQPVFYGLLDTVGRRIENKMVFDWSDGVLIGKIGRQVDFYYSKPRFRLTNYYPFLENNSDTSFLIQGGVENYICQTPKDPLTGTTYLYDRITIANKNDYQKGSFAPPYQMATRYIPLATNITFENDGVNGTPVYLIGFSDANTFYQSNCTTSGIPFATSAVFQSTEYLNIQNTIVQTPLPFRVVTDPKLTPKTKTVTIGCFTITFKYAFTTNGEFLMCFTDSSTTLTQFIEYTEGSVSIDQLVKVPFYTDNRVQPSNYYSRPLEVDHNTLSPTSTLMSPHHLYQDGLPFGVRTHHHDHSSNTFESGLLANIQHRVAGSRYANEKLGTLSNMSGRHYSPVTSGHHHPNDFYPDLASGRHYQRKLMSGRHYPSPELDHAITSGRYVDTLPIKGSEQYVRSESLRARPSSFQRIRS